MAQIVVKEIRMRDALDQRVVLNACMQAEQLLKRAKDLYRSCIERSSEWPKQCGYARDEARELRESNSPRAQQDISKYKLKLADMVTSVSEDRNKLDKLVIPLRDYWRAVEPKEYQDNSDLQSPNMPFDVVKDWPMRGEDTLVLNEEHLIILASLPAQPLMVFLANTPEEGRNLFAYNVIKDSLALIKCASEYSSLGYVRQLLEEAAKPLESSNID